MNSYSIGRGTKMSIAKAALVLYYRLVNDPNEYFDETSFFDYGELNWIHDIIDIAGAKHCSCLTPAQVIARLRNSPYWKCRGCRGFYSGIGNGKATLCWPSELGKAYYEQCLKQQDANEIA